MIEKCNFLSLPLEYRLQNQHQRLHSKESHVVVFASHREYINPLWLFIVPLWVSKLSVIPLTWTSIMVFGLVHPWLPRIMTERLGLLILMLSLLSGGCWIPSFVLLVICVSMLTVFMNGWNRSIVALFTSCLCICLIRAIWHCSWYGFVAFVSRSYGSQLPGSLSSVMSFG